MTIVTQASRACPQIRLFFFLMAAVSSFFVVGGRPVLAGGDDYKIYIDNGGDIPVYVAMLSKRRGLLNRTLKLEGWREVKSGTWNTPMFEWGDTYYEYYLAFAIKDKDGRFGVTGYRPRSGASEAKVCVPRDSAFKRSGTWAELQRCGKDEVLVPFAWYLAADSIEGDYYMTVKIQPRASDRLVVCLRGCGEKAQPRAEPKAEPKTIVPPPETTLTSDMVALGVKYLDGVGVDQDYEHAMHLFAKAADRGNLSAQNRLAIMYKNALGVSRDYTKAVQWFSRAAERDYKYAQVNLGDMYRYGRGVGIDYELALRWFKKAADQGYESGLTRYVSLLDAVATDDSTFDGRKVRRLLIDRPPRAIDDPAVYRFGKNGSVFGLLSESETADLRQRLRDLPSDLNLANTVYYAKPLSFYSESRFVYAIEGMPPKDRAFLVENPDGVKWLDGTNRPVYELNEKHPILLSKATVSDYVRFFFATTRGRTGRFLLIEEMEDFAWKELPAERISERIRSRMQPMALDSVSTGGDFALTAIILFKDSLFSAKIVVQPNGHVSLQDEEIILETLPVRRDIFTRE